MMDLLWQAAYLAASIWGAGNTTVNVPDSGTEAQEARPLPTLKCDALPQVQLDIVVATINRSARPKLTSPWTDSAKNGVDPKSALAFLHKLRDEGVVKFGAEPRVRTLSGHTATVVANGEEIPLTTADGIITQTLGTQIHVLPKVMADGKIRLTVGANISTLDLAKDDPMGKRALRVQHCETTAELKAGQTLAVNLVTQEERETVKHVTLWDNPLLFGPFWMTLRNREGINEDTVILVTPRIVTPCCCEAEEQAPDTRVVACWDNRAGSMVGSVYLFSEETKRPIAAAGRLEVQAFDMAPVLRGEEPRLLAQWTFDAETLKKLQRRDLIGDGYTLTAPWADLPANVENVKLTTVYVPEQGASRSEEPTYMARRSADADAVQPGEERTKVVLAQAVSNKGRSRQMTLADITRLSKAGLDCKVIWRQIEVTETTKDHLRVTLADVVQLCRAGVSNELIEALLDWTDSDTDLTVDDLIHLREQGVDNGIISAMQQRAQRARLDSDK